MGSARPSRSCSSATGRLVAPRGRADEREATGRRAARRPVGRARRLGRVRDRDRRGAGRRGYPVDQVLIDLDGAWWWLPPGHAAAIVRPPPTTIPSPSGAEGPWPSVRPSTGSPPLDPPRSSRSPSTARSARTGRSRRCSRRPDSPTPVPAWRPRRSAWTRPSSSDSAAGSACRSSTGARSGRPAGETIPAGVRLELEAFAAGTGDPRLMVKPARLGSSVGMTLVHDPPSSTAALETAFRYDTLALVEAYLAGRARPRGVGHRQRPGAASSSTARARSSPATSSTTTPPSTRRACPRRRPGPR